MVQSNPNIVYALSEKRLLRSSDGGFNWKSTTLTFANYNGKAYDIVACPTDENLILARWGNSIYRSIDGGENWKAIFNNLYNNTLWDCSIHSEMLEWDLNNDKVVYFLNQTDTSVTVYKSSDKGATFNVLSTLNLPSTLTGSKIGWSKIFTPKNNPESLYVAYGTGANPYAHNAAHMFKLNKSSGFTELSRINMILGDDKIPGNFKLHHGDIQMDRYDENKIVFGGYFEQKLKLSIDNGVTFNEQKGRSHSDMRTIDFINGNILVGTDGECVFSDDFGANLKTVSNPIGNHELWGFGSAFKSNTVVSGNNHGPFMIKQNYEGFDWLNGFGADQGNTDINPLDEKYVYSSGNYRILRVGDDKLLRENNVLDLGGIYEYFNQLEFHPNKYHTMITHHGGRYPENKPDVKIWKNSLIKTEDNGNSLTIVKTFSDRVFREKICYTQPNNMIVVEGLTNNKIWKTNDEGLTWSDITPSTLITGSTVRNISDIAISDVDPKQIWITYSGVQNSCKILKTLDGGITWQNLSDPILTTSPITKIIFQRGTDGGVYIANKSGVYYRNNKMANWSLLGNGLPTCEIRFMFINYNEGKLKIGTSRGAFMNDLYEKSRTMAQISVNKNKINCPTIDILNFKDYSVVQNASATWSWKFPGGTPSNSNEENPIVSYADATPGTYDVSLTVTDANGTSTQTLKNFIHVGNLCGTSIPDGLPGNSISLKGKSKNDYIDVSDLNLKKNSFTFSCWIKPDGIQEDYSAIFMTQGSTALSLNYTGAKDNSLGFHPDWSWNSKLKTQPNEWSHVALVSDGVSVKIYVNGVEAKRNFSINAAEPINKIFIGRAGNGRSDRFVNAEFDEVTIWDRPLTLDEIRYSRHLTKSKFNDSILQGISCYFQFNENSGNITLNKNRVKGFATYMGEGYSRNLSTAPVFEGTSEKIAITTSGVKSFPLAQLQMEFEANTTLPDGDVWCSRSSINPTQLNIPMRGIGEYYVLNNYGKNVNFSPIKSIGFKSTLLDSINELSNLVLLARTENNDTNNWSPDLLKERLSKDGVNMFKCSSLNAITNCGQLVIAEDKSIPNLKIGNAFSLTGNSGKTYLELKENEFNTNSFTFSCWVKPNGVQEDYSAIFMSVDGNNTFGLNFMNGNNTIGFHPNYGWSSNLVAKPNEWSHIAMVSNGSSVKLYINGIEAINNGNINVYSFKEILLGCYSKAYSNRYANIELDEVCFWNRALDINEIRNFKHLIKTDKQNPIFKDLAYYFQFNENDFSGNTVYSRGPKPSISNIIGNNFTQVTSTAPCFNGIAEKKTISSNGLVDFSSLGVQMDINDAISVNGDLWAFKSLSSPNKIPTEYRELNQYFILNNYGGSPSNSFLNKISFNIDYLDTIPDEKSSFVILNRNDNSENNWISSSMRAIGSTKINQNLKLDFNYTNTPFEFGQYLIVQDTNNFPTGIPGKSLILNGQNGKDYVELKELSCLRNSFSFSCWIKPKGIQQNYSAIFMSQGDSSPIGLNFMKGNNTLGVHPNYTWSSNLVANPNEWSHVAFVSDGVDLRVYLNGKMATVKSSTNATPLLNLDLARYGRGYSDRYANIEIDEVCVWNKALSTDDIRSMIHLTKDNYYNSIQEGLVAYLQFNTDSGNIIKNSNFKYNSSVSVKSFGTTLSSVQSSCPVFNGSSEKLHIVSSGNFSSKNLNLDLTIDNSGIPNGDVWFYKSSINPNYIPTNTNSSGFYTIIRNFGQNNGLMSKIKFMNVSKPIYNYDVNKLNLFERNNSKDFNDWQTIPTSKVLINNLSSIDTDFTFTTLKPLEGQYLIGFDNQQNLKKSNDGLTSIEELNQNPKVYSYPNPLKQGDEISIFIPNEFSNTSMLYVYDIQGKSVAFSNLKQGTNQIKLNLSIGTYIFLIHDNQRREELKIVIKD